MIKDVYDYYPSQDMMSFLFLSEGPQGTIPKIIIFTRQEKNKWNLAFGDLKEDDFDDLVISNNQDAMKIIRTVASTAIEFLKTYPKRSIFIRPVDQKRKTLYNYVFQKYFKEINTIFDVIGTIQNTEESYLPVNFYDSFTITLKSKLK